ncbi:MAG TPA: biosynthetic peptidoglycan transglycosylase [Polyangiaceae bacterium]|nr:biosynthetic peptidoglycan transglycosylase [Polyangiaceae bacterium]
MSVLADLPRRAKLAALLGLGSLVLAAVALGFGPIARARAAAAAERRGLSLEIGQVRAGLGGIWLRDVELRAPRMPAATMHIAALRVGFGWRLNVASVTVHGARLELAGEPEELARQWAALRGAAKPDADGAAAELQYAADGIDVVWHVRAHEPAQRLWGLSYQRAEAREQIAIDLLHLREAGFDLSARKPRATLLRRPSASQASSANSLPRQLESLQAEGLDLGIVLEAPRAQANAATPAQKSPAFQPDPLRGPKLRAGLAELSSWAARSLPDGAGLNLEGVNLRFSRGADTLNFGPSSLRALRVATEVELSLAPKAEASGTPLEFRVSLPIERGDVRASLRGGPVSLRSLGVREHDFGLIGVELAMLQAKGDVTLAADGSTLSFDGSGALSNVALKRAELSTLPLSGIQLAFRAKGTTSLDGARLVLEDGELAFGDVSVRGSGSLNRSERTLSTRWQGGVPLASCQAFLDATPRGLAPLIASLRMTGTFGVKADLDFDSEHPNDTRVRLNVANDCHIEQVPAQLNPRRFSHLWQREVRGANKQPIEIESGPGSADWVPIDAISPNMEVAVQVCEDGHFQYHHGFDFEAIQNSIKDNLIKGRFARGASTISMQLAKNLYLSKEKTLGRKLQEAVLTQLLEQELSKRELLELYLNVIEYAPGVYGIGPAAHYYFAKRPSELSLGQALYIASILPNPERQHFDADGKVSAAWAAYLQRLMRIAKKIGQINEEQLAAGLAEHVVFHVADSGGGPQSSAPYSGEGTDTPSELSP